jgi:hypothetical protein
VSAGIMGTLCWMGLRMSGFDAYSRFLPRLGVFSALVLGGAATYLLLAWALRCGELFEIYGIAMRGDAEAASLASVSQES